jgi:hypothetical protein
MPYLTQAIESTAALYSIMAVRAFRARSGKPVTIIEKVIFIVALFLACLLITLMSLGGRQSYGPYFR